MKNRIKNIIMAVVIAISGMVFSSPVYAGSCTNGVGGNCNPVCSQSDLTAEQRNAAGCDADANDYVGKHVENIINAAVSVVGIIGVLVIVIAGQRFLTASGDPGKIKQAKDMILWAVVGIVIAVLAWAIVTFVLGALAPAGAGATPVTP